jgi:glycosyltransferase involved in cell wall biosynthesis
VYNGGKYLQLCVESILSQNYGKFELIVLDNRSSDQAINKLQELPEPQINILTSKSNLTIQENGKRVLSISKKKYMNIIGHDDLFDSNYLEIMKNLIQRNPDAVLYHAHFRLINTKGKVLKKCFPMPERENAS